MELRQLKTFITIARTMSFTKAAAELGYAQSTITGHIQSLEDELGILLFERLNKQIKLTKDGEDLLTYADQILRLSAEAQDQISSPANPKGTLTIGTAESLCTHRLPIVFKTFRARYPRVDLSFRFDTCAHYQTYLRKNEADAIFILDVPVHDPELIAHHLFEEPMVLITSPDHALAGRPSVSPQDLHGQPMVLTDSDCSYRRIFESILTQAGVKPASVIGINSTEVMKRFVMDGWGIGFLPQVTVIPELQSSQLVSLPWDGPDFHIHAQLTYHKDKWLSPALKAFIAVTLQTLKDTHRTTG